MFISIGTSGFVYPAAGLTSIAERAGALVIHVNPDVDCAPANALRVDDMSSLLEWL